MSGLDITGADETPLERAAFGEALSQARQRDQFDRAHNITTPWERAESTYDAARSMIAVVLRKRQEREARTARRELAAYLVLGALLLALMGVALLGALLLTPRWVADDAVTAAVLTAGMLLGLNLRSRL